MFAREDPLILWSQNQHIRTGDRDGETWNDKRVFGSKYNKLESVNKLSWKLQRLTQERQAKQINNVKNVPSISGVGLSERCYHA